MVDLGTLHLIIFDARLVAYSNESIENVAFATYGYEIPGYPYVVGNSNSNKVTIYAERIDVVVDKKSHKNFVVLGEEVAYTIEIFNNGTVDIENVRFIDILPEGLELIDGTLKVKDSFINEVDIKDGINIGKIQKNSSAVVEYRSKLVFPNCSMQLMNTAKVEFNYTLLDGRVEHSESSSLINLQSVVSIGIANFKQLSVEEYLEIPNKKPEAEYINNVIGTIKINKYNVINTVNLKSLEGQYLSGNKLIVHGILNVVVEYTACEREQSSYSAHYNIPFSTFIVLPHNYVNSSKIDIEGIIEDIYCNLLDCRKFFVSITLLVNAKIRSY